MSKPSFNPPFGPPSPDGRAPLPSEACDFCRAPLGDEHQHLLESGTRKLGCVCDACAILFSGQQQKYRRIPRSVRFLRDFRLTDAQWEGLMIPIGIAFLFWSSIPDRTVALYPSPAGPVESLLPLEAWHEIADGNPAVREMEPDVEGLLAYRVDPVREHYIVPIDECFRLAGLFRMKWTGFSGGTEVWVELQRFLVRLKQRSS